MGIICRTGQVTESSIASFIISCSELCEKLVSYILIYPLSFNQCSIDALQYDL